MDPSLHSNLPRWVRIIMLLAYMPLQIQMFVLPKDCLKLCLIAYLPTYLVDRYFNLNSCTGMYNRGSPRQCID